MARTTRRASKSGAVSLRARSAAASRAPRPLWAVCVLIGAGVLAYANSLGAPFIFDDTGPAIVQNRFITSLSPLTQAMRAPVQSAFAGRPVASLSLAISYASGGLSPSAFRIWNIGVLVSSALLLFGILRRTLRRSGGETDTSAMALAFAAALLWLVHPLQTEVVDYVTQRTESMMGGFYLLTLYAAIRTMEEERPSRGWTAVSVLACTLGMACKEAMVTAPLMVLLYDLVFGARSLREALRRRGVLYAGLGATWLLLGLLIAEAPRFRSAGFSSGVSAWAYLLNQAVMIVTYLKLSVWPHPLVLDYGRTHPIAIATALPFALVVTALLAAVAVAWIRHRQLAYLGTWFFVTLAPSSSIVPIATEVGAERRMYLPLAAVVILIVLAVRAAARRWLDDGRLRRPAAAMAMLGAVSIILGAVTMARNREYHDPVGIWQTVLDRRPQGRAHYNLAIELSERGRKPEALEHYRMAVADEPGAHYALGFELGSSGQFAEAAGHLREFLRLLPDDFMAPKASFLLGQSLVRLGQPAEAEQRFRDTLRMVPRDADARGALADIFVSQERFDDAIAFYREYLTLVPNSIGAHHNLGLALVATHKDTEAIAEFEKAVALSQSDPSLRLSLGNALASTGRLDEAVAHYRIGLQIAPSNARMMSALALTLAAGGQVDEPLALFKRALQLAPDDTDIQSDYATTVARWRTGR